jgi:hypothetical protein
MSFILAQPGIVPVLLRLTEAMIRLDNDNKIISPVSIRNDRSRNTSQQQKSYCI